MRLHELLRTGDVVHTEFHLSHYVVSYDFVWNRITGSKDDLEDFDYSTMPKWVKAIVRGTTDITQKLRNQLAAEFKFGTRVANDVTPESEAFFIKYNDGNCEWADVAYLDPNGEAMVQETAVAALSIVE